MNCPKCDTPIPVVKTFRDPEETHRLRKCVCGVQMLTKEVEIPIGVLGDLRRYEWARRVALGKLPRRGE